MALASLSRRETPRVHGKGLRTGLQDIGLHPSEEAVAIARDGVPRLVVGVVTFVVAMGVRGMRAAGNDGNGRHRPTRQDPTVRDAGVEVFDDLLQRALRVFR